jgi:twitching motility protein PilT
MEAAIDMAESGHLVIGTLHTKGCAETIDRIINFYEVRDQSQIKNLLSSLLKVVVSQRLLKSAKGRGLVLVPEVMLVDNTVAACIRKEKFSVSEIEDAIQGSHDKGSISLINSLAELYVAGKLTLDQVKAQIDEKNYESLNRTIMQLNLKRNATRTAAQGAVNK